MSLEENKLSVQDLDLLGRMNQYFNTIQSRLREGQGWLIFNTDRNRTARISRFIAERLSEYRPLLSSYSLTWRDFALDAYIAEVELPQAESGIGDESGLIQKQYQIAGKVARDMRYHVLYCDLFILTGIRPEHNHEVKRLIEIVELRQAKGLPTILVTPRSPDELAQELRALREEGGYWKRLYGAMYETSLIAL